MFQMAFILFIDQIYTVHHPTHYISHSERLTSKKEIHLFKTMVLSISQYTVTILRILTQNLNMPMGIMAPTWFARPQN